MDNIAIGLRKEGVRAVRVGRPDKINRILEEITSLGGAGGTPWPLSNGSSLVATMMIMMWCFQLGNSVLLRWVYKSNFTCGLKVDISNY